MASALLGSPRWSSLRDAAACCQSQVLPLEFGIIWVTFFAVDFFGLEFGERTSQTARVTMQRVDYGVLLIPCVLSLRFASALGMIIGVVSAAFNFIFKYAQLMVAEQLHVHSNVVRNFEKVFSRHLALCFVSSYEPSLTCFLCFCLQRAILSSVRPQIVTLRIRGFVFFGATLSLIATLTNNLLFAAVCCGRLGSAADD